jgi:hypothetical protein
MVFSVRPFDLACQHGRGGRRPGRHHWLRQEALDFTTVDEERGQA